MHLGVESIVILLRRILGITQAAAFVLASFAFVRILGLSDRLGNLVGLTVEFLHVRQLGSPLFVQGDQLIQLRRHAAVLAVGSNGGEVLEYELTVQHAVSFLYQRGWG